MSRGPPRIRVVELAGPLAGEVPTRLAPCIAGAVAERGLCVLATAGGTTPRGVYEQLAARDDIAWDRVLLVFGDERCVPPDDRRANFRMVAETLLAPLGPRAPRVLRMEGEDPSPEAAARRYEQALRAAVAGDPPRIDIALLGIGGDGHTAGLFPGDPRLDDDGGRLVVAVPLRPDGLAGITLTPTALHAARRRVFLVAGDAKAAVVRAVAAAGSPLVAARFAPAVVVHGSG